MNRKQEKIKIIRSEHLNDVDYEAQEFLNCGYEFMGSQLVGKELVIIMVKYKEPEKESVVLVPTKKPRLSKTNTEKVELQIPGESKKKETK